MSLHIIPRTLLLYALLLFTLAGCASTIPYGQWKVSRSAVSDFNNGEIAKDHRYYYIGSKVEPDSVIAIHKNFTLRSRIWVPIELTPAQLKSWNFVFSLDHSMGCPYSGGFILAEDGTYVGFWHGKDTLNTVRVPEPGVIEVYQPYSLPGSMCERDKYLRDL